MSEIVQPEAGRRYQQESARVAMRVLADNINEGLSEDAWLVDGSDPRQTQYSEHRKAWRAQLIRQGLLPHARK